ncbi:SusD/RagB family nutrient-binding outer membrane lipoprotein [Barnesiella viscericola]|uniref:SusD/RagB family nutrient-binding outer membrane lipoprotein n=1 Tax=Barnesiella viscericola TaxID=397865 RepID=UPI0025A31504|nr:SusD/RagB family nutrient-binding outer membrane lipoprotein [Barnesiella viscericola]MDM8268252.1 SusD/RagB family nutrient-binding outer membrane lipoprotein [Barnesiella viscericola]
MKKTILTAFCAMLAAASLHSCLDFDMPTDTFTGGQTDLDPVVYRGKADSIDYRKVISEQGFNDAMSDLQQYFAQMKTAQYYLRGGKDGQTPGPHQYQYVYNITVDNYAGYMVVPHNFSHGGGGLLNSTYAYNQDYCDGPYGAFLSIKNNIANMINHPMIDSIPEMKAIGLLIFDYSAQEMVDLYGSIPYVDHKSNKESNPFTFNKMADIYASIVDNLDTINACLKHFDSRPDWYQAGVQSILGQYDVMTQDKSVASWCRLANSLKLRMAMHTVKVQPSVAQKWAEEAVQAGVIETTAQELLLDPMVMGYTNPLFEIANNWGDTRLNASFESLLASLKHPYLEYVFDKNSNIVVNSSDPNDIMQANTRIMGLRAGIRMIPGQAYKDNFRIAYSSIKNNGEMAMAPLYLMKVSEVQFLRAEGDLRGWTMGGSAQQFYEQGIRNAQVEHRLMSTYYPNAVDEYMSLEAPVAYKYVDQYDHSYDAESVTTIGVKWNEGDSKETKLEKIITQKYIAAFPYSYEAWNDLRRTGYPKQFEVLNVEDGDGSLVQGDIIRKIPLPGRDTSVGMSDITASGIEALGGSDTQGTRVWWDVAGSNF